MRDRRRWAPVLAGGVAATGALVWYLTLPGRSVLSAAQELQAVLSGTRTLTAGQQAMADLITARFGGVGYGWLAPAAVANAYAESRLDPLASGDHGHSIGLFQLSDFGAGAGLTVADRQDPDKNIGGILAVLAGADGAALRGAHGTATHAELSSLFAQHLEQCAACGGSAGTSELTARAALVVDLYGSAVASLVPV